MINNLNSEITEKMKANRSILIMLGILQIIFGIIALSTPWVASVAITEIISILFIITGVVQFFQIMHSHFGSKAKYASGALISILYVIAGCYLIFNPAKAVITLTLIIGWFFIIKGAIILIESFRTKTTKSWMMVNGAITLILGILILSDIQGGAIWIIGILVGINLVFTGWAALFMGLSIPKA